MTQSDLEALLGRVADGELTPHDAARRLTLPPQPAPAGFESLVGADGTTFARVDVARERRRGFPEVVLAAGKTPEQVAAIVRSLAGAGGQTLVTRADERHADAVRAACPDATWRAEARAVVVSRRPPERVPGTVAVLSAGTSDLPVAEEAALTAELMGVTVRRLFDVGVAGLHRLLAEASWLGECHALVVVAGMEAALAPVVAGLVPCPVYAVPTSVGYGASYGGLAALLALLNGCAPGVTVVNIDNGFGAGYAAALTLAHLHRNPPQPERPGE